MLENMIWENISLEKMLNVLVDCVCNNVQAPPFYYRREWEKGHPEYDKITEVDLLRGRFKTADDDFSEYEWELEKSNIYIRKI